MLVWVVIARPSEDSKGSSKFLEVLLSLYRFVGEDDIIASQILYNTRKCYIEIDRLDVQRNNENRNEEEKIE